MKSLKEQQAYFRIEAAAGRGKLIKLNRGLVTLVDAHRFEELNAYQWSVVDDYKNQYAIRSEWLPEIKRVKQTRMHRQISNAAKNEQVHHINNYGLDNRNDNFRLGGAAMNARGQQRKREGCSSRFRGVSKIGPNWETHIWVDKGSRLIGSFSEEKAAARAYDAAAKFYFGEAAALNFPSEVQEYYPGKFDKVAKHYCWVAGRRRWLVWAYPAGKKIHIGYFRTETEAQEAAQRSNPPTRKQICW